MKIAFIVSETFTEKRHGGFGWLVKLVGSELVRRGYEVYVLAWRDTGYPLEYTVNGMNIITYEYHFETRSVLRHLRDYWEFLNVLKDIDADVFISIEAMVETLIAETVKRNSFHVVWAQDPFDWNDYELLSSVDPYYRISKLRFYMNRIIFRQAYKKADLILTQARYYIEKLRHLFGINPNIVYLIRNPIYPIPKENTVKKSDYPMICYLGRMDPQKRYWMFFDLARKYPDIKFVAMGKPSILYEDKYKEIADKYVYLNNLQILGLVDEKKKCELLDKCWILVLPSIREGLPIAMLEALAHKVALLSSVNPDGITERFGYWVRDDNFEKGLNYLLENDIWKDLGEQGYNYVHRYHRLNAVLNDLILLLEKLEKTIRAK